MGLCKVAAGKTTMARRTGQQRPARELRYRVVEFPRRGLARAEGDFAMNGVKAGTDGPLQGRRVISHKLYFFS